MFLSSLVNYAGSEGLVVHSNFIVHELMSRSGYASHRGQLLQEWQGEQGGLGRLHQDDQEEHKPERQGCCHHGCLKGLSLLSSLNFEIKNIFMNPESL